MDALTAGKDVIEKAYCKQMDIACCVRKSFLNLQNACRSDFPSFAVANSDNLFPCYYYGRRTKQHKNQGARLKSIRDESRNGGLECPGMLRKEDLWCVFEEYDTVGKPPPPKRLIR